METRFAGRVLSLFQAQTGAGGQILPLLGAPNTLRGQIDQLFWPVISLPGQIDQPFSGEDGASGAFWALERRVRTMENKDGNSLVT